MHSFSFLDSSESEEWFVRLVLEDLGTLDKLEYHYIDHVYPDHYHGNYCRVKYDVYYSSLNKKGMNLFLNLDKIIYGYDNVNKEYLSWKIFKIENNIYL